MGKRTAFAVIGGDMRQAYLARLLAQEGFRVRTYALERAGTTDGVRQCASAAEAAEGADCVILPLPLSSGSELNAPKAERHHDLGEIFAALRPEQELFAGRVDASARALAEGFGLELQDYFEREELAVFGAVATAEGAIQIAMEELPITLFGAKAMVIGYGRLGKALAARLHSLGAEVTVSARSCADRAWIRAFGYSPEDTNALDGRLGKYDVIFNTVPAPVLGEARLREVKKGCLCMDLASKPGGMDFAAAARLNVKAVWALSLPGEVAPESSGRDVKDTIFNMLREKGKAVETEAGQ